MCRESILLNGITQSVSPMRFSQHPRTKLTNGDSPPVERRPRHSEAPPAAYNARRLRSFSAGRFVSSLGAWGANKRLQLAAAVGGVRRPWPAAVGSGGRIAAGARSVVRWFTRGRS